MIKKKSIFIILILIVGAVLILLKMRPKASTEGETKEIKPTVGTIESTISTTGTVLPKNRLEIKPPVNGRLESILVKEGEQVKPGQTLAWMSSTERAALLDSAQSQGKEKVKYWEQAYKPIALLAPISGEVIVATMQPGQTVTASDAVIVLSDQLIVRAQVDETDIGKVKLSQKAEVTIDAYPDDLINATVEHIYYESETVNNVTIYKVDLTPDKVPEFFRSGMNANIAFIEQSREDVLLLPIDSVQKEKDESFVFVKENGAGGPVRRVVKTGITDDKNIEIISGINKDDTIIVKSKKFSLPISKTSSSPLTPFRQRRGGSSH